MGNGVNLWVPLGYHQGVDRARFLFGDPRGELFLFT